MLFNLFAGPVFTSEDIPKLILLVVVMAAPFILGMVALGLGIRDLVKKKLHRSTVIAAIGAIITFLFIYVVFGGAL